MSYPFPTFPLVNRVGITTPVANIDARYGPWPTFNDALTGFNTGLRFVGLTVAVSGSNGITEYWYKDGVANNNLVLKQTGGGGSVQPEDVLPIVTNYLSTNNVLVSGLSVVGDLSTQNFGTARQWYSTYTTVQTNSANWAQNTLELIDNPPARTLHSINGSQYGIVTQTVSADQIYSINNIIEGRTITLLLSANHEAVKRHVVSVFKLPGGLQPSKISINGTGQSDNFYTFQNHITKVTLTVAKTVIGIAEIIRTDLNFTQGGLGFLSLEQGISVEQILQENGDRLVIRNFA